MKYLKVNKTYASFFIFNLLFFSLASCTRTLYHKTYPGSKLPKEQVAFLTNNMWDNAGLFSTKEIPTVDTGILSVDCEWVVRDETQRFELLPGKHILALTYSYSPKTFSIIFEAKPEHTYMPVIAHKDDSIYLKLFDVTNRAKPRGVEITEVTNDLCNRALRLSQNAKKRIQEGEKPPPQVEDKGNRLVNCFYPAAFTKIVSEDISSLISYATIPPDSGIEYACVNNEEGEALLAWRKWYCEGEDKSCVLSEWINGQPSFGTYVSGVIEGVIRFEEVKINEPYSHTKKAESTLTPPDFSETKTKDPDEYIGQGLGWMVKGDYDRAIADYSKAIEIDPENADAYDKRGFVYYLKGDYDRAIADYSKAIEIDPENADAYAFRGMTRSFKGDYDRAIADCSKAIELDPAHYEAYNNRGNAWGKKGDHDRQIADYSKAIEIDPTRSLAYHNRGLAWEEKGDDNRATADLSKASEIDKATKTDP